MRRFLLSIGVLGEEGARQFAAMPMPEPVPAPAVPDTDNDFFYANQIRATTGYRPRSGGAIRCLNQNRGRRGRNISRPAGPSLRSRAG
jgi:hypothetical protein